MVGVHKVLAEKELRAFQRRQLLTEREQREMEEKAVQEETVELKSPSSDSSTEVDSTDESDGESSSTPSTPKRSCRARMNIVTPQLTAAWTAPNSLTNLRFRYCQQQLLLYGMILPSWPSIGRRS